MRGISTKAYGDLVEGVTGDVEDDLDLDPAFWPDPAAMNAELRALGYRVMISCWPRFMKESRHYAALEAMGGFLQLIRGLVKLAE